MNFFTHHKRLIALVAVFSFMYLVGISTMPLRAETTTANDQQPGAIEKAGSSGAAVHKSSPIIPILIGVVVVGAVAAVLILVVFKSKYDIRGTWSILIDNFWTGTLTFSGDKKSGTWTNPDAWVEKDTSYTVDGKNVSWTGEIYFAPGTDWKATDDYTGKFDTKTTMSGTYISDGVYGYFTGIWTATKN